MIDLCYPLRQPHSCGNPREPPAGRAGSNTTGTVSVVLPENTSIGSVNIASIISQLKALGYITAADTGILDVAYGIEAPYGGAKTVKVDAFSVTSG